MWCGLGWPLRAEPEQSFWEPGEGAGTVLTRSRWSQCLGWHGAEPPCLEEGQQAVLAHKTALSPLGSAMRRTPGATCRPWPLR